MHDHPLDEVYRKKFIEAKKERNRRLGINTSVADDSEINLSRLGG